MIGFFLASSRSSKPDGVARPGGNLRFARTVLGSGLLCACLLFFLSGPAAFAAGANDLLGIGQTVSAPTTAAKPKNLAPAVAGVPATPASGSRTEPPQSFDYSANLNSDVFGANLFTGAFAREGATQFNPDYAVAVGDNIQVRLWGAFEFESVLAVDPKGNIFVPHVGPVQVLGVRNQDLQRLMESSVGRVYRANVYSYASLASAQPVRIFVSGYVNRPGLYSGTSMDSLLHYLDQAGGIDPERGSFLTVQVKRATLTRATMSLYDFLLDGRIPLIQLSSGDVIFVGPRQSTVKVSGLTENAKRFEFTGNTLTITQVMRLAKPRAQATNVRVLRNTGPVRSTEYFFLSDAARVALQNGDEVEFTSDQKPGTIAVRVEGEHESPQEYVLPYGTKLGEVLRQIRFSERSDSASVQLFRLSVKERQRLALQTTLKFLENAALTARSGTNEEAQLRKEEAELLLQWVERGKSVEPSGQVFIAQASDRDDLLLENGDILRVPTKDGLVLVSGEVILPNTIAYDKTLSVADYIKNSGGYTQNANASRVIVAHRDGSFDEASAGGGMFSSFAGEPTVRPGDHILVLPRIDVKSRQIFRDVVEALFRIAVVVGIVHNF